MGSVVCIAYNEVSTSQQSERDNVHVLWVTLL